MAAKIFWEDWALASMCVRLKIGAASKWQVSAPEKKQEVPSRKDELMFRNLVWGVAGSHVRTGRMTVISCLRPASFCATRWPKKLRLKPASRSPLLLVRRAFLQLPGCCLLLFIGLSCLHFRPTVNKGQGTTGGTLRDRNHLRFVFLKTVADEVPYG